MARARCSDDPNQIFTEHELITAGQRYALDPTHTESVNEVCDHSGSSMSVRPPRGVHKPDPQPKDEVIFAEVDPITTSPEGEE